MENANIVALGSLISGLEPGRFRLRCKGMQEFDDGLAELKRDFRAVAYQLLAHSPARPSEHSIPVLGRTLE